MIGRPRLAPAALLLAICGGLLAAGAPAGVAAAPQPVVAATAPVAAAPQPVVAARATPAAEVRAASPLPDLARPFVAPRPFATKAPELRITTDATYVVQPPKGRIHVTLQATITNTHVDKPSVRTYYDTAYLAVLPNTEHFTASSPGVKAAVRVRSATRSYTLLTIDLGRKLFSGKHTPLTLGFDVPDRGGAALRDVRVGASLVAFPVWAFATDATPGSTATVVFPPRYNVQLQSGSMGPSTSADDGTLRYSSGTLKEPLTFYAYFIADRPGAFDETLLVANVRDRDVPLAVRAWSDDATWAKRVGSLVKRGLPALSTAVGLPFAGDGMVVQETVSRTIGGYAGVYDPVASTVQVAYSAGPFVVLHETAHAWFNGRLVADRWISEAFASFYAQRAAAALKVVSDPPTLTPELEAAAIPLNAWPGVGRASEKQEDYAYAATFKLAGLIAGRAGDDGLKAVWKAAAAGEYAYQPYRAGAAPEIGAPPPDWRGLLDLLEERTTADYTDLWRAWVVRPADARLLDQRAQARAAYAAAVVAAGDWELPRSVRAAMSAWRFDEATTLIGQVRTALAQRTEISARSQEAGLTAPPTLRTAFESDAGPTVALVEAEAEVQTIDAILAAEASGHDVGGLLEQVGLAGLSPERDLVAARDDFALGNLDGALAAAAAARATFRDAGGRGQQRLLLVAVVVAFGAMVLVATMLVRRSRREGRRRREALDA